MLQLSYPEGTSQESILLFKYRYLSINHTSTRNTMVMGWLRSWYADSGVFNTLADTMSELMYWLCRDIFRFLQSKDNIISKNYNISIQSVFLPFWKPFHWKVLTYIGTWFLPLLQLTICLELLGTSPYKSEYIYLKIEIGL